MVVLLYLAVLLDLYSRRVVGGALSDCIVTDSSTPCRQGAATLTEASA
jgi:hypothetical protein